MEGKKNLIIGLVLMVLAIGGFFLYKKMSPEAASMTTPASSNVGQPAVPQSPSDPYSTYNAPAK